MCHDPTRLSPTYTSSCPGYACHQSISIPANLVETGNRSAFLISLCTKLAPRWKHHQGQTCASTSDLDTKITSINVHQIKNCSFHEPHYPIRLNLTQISPPDKSTYIHVIKNLMKEFFDHNVSLTDGSKTRNRTSHPYSINGEITSHRVRNIASIFTVELMAIFACLSQLTQLLPSSKYNYPSHRHTTLTSTNQRPIQLQLNLTKNVA